MHAGVGEARRVARRGAVGAVEHVLRPAGRRTEVDEAVGEGPEPAVRQGGGFRGERMARLDGPRLEQRCEGFASLQ